MSRLLYLIFIMMTSMDVSHSGGLIDLQSMNFDSRKGVVYLAERCASVSLVMLGVSFNKDDIEVNRYLNEKYDFFSEMAVRIQAEISNDISPNNINKDLSKISDEITSLTKLYKAMMDSHYLKTGKYIPDIISNDTVFCRIIYNKINKL